MYKCHRDREEKAEVTSGSWLLVIELVISDMSYSCKSL